MGTIGAVITALYLARRDKRIRLAVNAGIRVIITQGVPGPHPECLCISVVNVGHREAQVTNLGWKVGLFRRMYAVQTIVRDAGSSPLPVRLKDGDEAQWLIPLHDDNRWVEDFARTFLQPWPSLRVRLVWLIVTTSIGVRFAARIEKSFRDDLLKAATKQKHH